MAVTSGKQLAVGMRYARAYQIDSSGYIDSPDAVTPYEGLEFGGPKSFELTIPDARRIVHIGNDRVLALDFLPPTEPPAGVLRIARSEMALNAILMNVTDFTVGEAKMLPWQTEQQGNEIDIAVLTYQQSLDAVTKQRRWRGFIMPSCRVLPKLTGMTDAAAEFVYELAPNAVSSHLWGKALAVGTEGATESSIFETMTTYRPFICGWVGDGVATEFLFPTDKPMADVAKGEVWIDGVLDGTAAWATDKVTPTVMPGDGAKIVAFYEY